MNEGDTIRLPCFVDDSGELDQNLNVNKLFPGKKENVCG